MRDHYKPSEQLQAVALWVGSDLDLAHRSRFLSIAMLVDKRDRLRRCDDRTPKENQLLRALNVELA